MWVMGGMAALAVVIAAAVLINRPPTFDDLKGSAISACQREVRTQLDDPGAAELSDARVTETVWQGADPVREGATYRVAVTMNGQGWECFTNVDGKDAYASVTVSP